MLSGLVLAGGESRRMGRDKAGLLLPDGRTLLQRQVATLREAGATIVQVSMQAGSEFQCEGARVVVDRLPQAGPMAGIVAGLRAAPAGLVLVLAVDMPAITTGHLRQLLGRATPDQGVVPTVGSHCEPLVAVYPSTLAASAEAWLAGGQHAVHAWVDHEVKTGGLHRWVAPADWTAAFRSWNSPADVAGA